MKKAEIEWKLEIEWRNEKFLQEAEIAKSRDNGPRAEDWFVIRLTNLLSLETYFGWHPAKEFICGFEW